MERGETEPLSSYSHTLTLSHFLRAVHFAALMDPLLSRYNPHDRRDRHARRRRL
jgi:hypothetical protein